MLRCLFLVMILCAGAQAEDTIRLRGELAPGLFKDVPTFNALVMQAKPKQAYDFGWSKSGGFDVKIRPSKVEGFKLDVDINKLTLYGGAAGTIDHKLTLHTNQADKTALVTMIMTMITAMK